eukprot:gene31765-biopygen6624
MAQSNVRAGRCRSSRWAEGSQTSSAADALWICQTDLLRCFDYKTRGTWRLVSKQACKAVGDNTRFLSWEGPDSAEAYNTNQRILQQCPVLEEICGLYPEAYQHLASIPTSLRTLEIQGNAFGNQLGLADLVQPSKCKIRLQRYCRQHVDFSPLTALTRLEEAVLEGLPASSLAGLDLHTALRSLSVRTALVDMKDESRDLAVTTAFHIALQAYNTNQRILQQCPVLENICGLYPEALQHLASIPTSLRTFEIQGYNSRENQERLAVMNPVGYKPRIQWYQLQHVNLSP